MDRHLRNLERRAVIGDLEAQAKLLTTRLRLQVPPLRNPDTSLASNKCHTWELRSADSFSWTNLRAYCGDETAQLITGKCELCRPWTPDNPCPSTRCDCCKGPVTIEGFCFPCQEFAPALLTERGKCSRHASGCKNCHPELLSLSEWLTGLLRLAEALPDVAVSGVKCPKHDYDYGDRVICERCNGTGTRTVETPASHYLAACVGLAIGRDVYDYLVFGAEAQMIMGETKQRARDALDVLERWTWCPCIPNREACRSTIVPEPHWAWGFLTTLGPFYDGSAMRTVIDGGCQAVKPEVVRNSARLMALEVTGGH